MAQDKSFSQGETFLQIQGLTFIETRPIPLHPLPFLLKKIVSEILC